MNLTRSLSGESVLLDDPLIARVTPHGIPDRIELKQWDGQRTGDGQQIFKPIDGVIRFADHRVDAGQIDGSISALVGVLRYRK